MEEYKLFLKLNKKIVKLIEERINDYCKIMKDELYYYSDGTDCALKTVSCYDEFLFNSIENISYEFEEDSITIRYEIFYSSCSTEYDSFSIDLDFLLNADLEEAKNILKEKIRISNDVEREKFEKEHERIKLEREEIVMQRKRTLYENLKKEFEGDKNENK